ncbi:hypothetical protein SAMN04490356_7645 [Streptomyces melanosporofaciens]|uniref:Uncharacterized protein n=1 Tax=Streptomyces melanosporofaciens TaxID=67327 RepID=A0A1H4Z5D9_STRMJ|nr:hypothetical protein SAMN04490356_7645 [Streptomyces melanosporofaciens]
MWRPWNTRVWGSDHTEGGHPWWLRPPGRCPGRSRGLLPRPHPRPRGPCGTSMRASPTTAMSPNAPGRRKTWGGPTAATPSPPAAPPNAELSAAELMKIADTVATALGSSRWAMMIPSAAKTPHTPPMRICPASSPGTVAVVAKQMLAPTPKAAASGRLEPDSVLEVGPCPARLATTASNHAHPVSPCGTRSPGAAPAPICPATVTLCHSRRRSPRHAGRRGSARPGRRAAARSAPGRIPGCEGGPAPAGHRWSVWRRARPDRGSPGSVRRSAPSPPLPTPPPASAWRPLPPRERGTPPAADRRASRSSTAVPHATHRSSRRSPAATRPPPARRTTRWRAR